jgi:dienelactone hydrolase
MTIDVQPVSSHFEDTELEGLLVCDSSRNASPAVLIFPTVVGRSDLELGFARQLAGLGYAAFVADLYGKANIGRPREECREMMLALLADRAKLQDRLLHVLAKMREQEVVDADRVAAIGYCFGGLCALDLARTGTDVRGVASFHGLFDPPGNLDGVPIAARVVAFHGWDDPMVPPDKVVALAAELTATGADWQIHGYGHTAHGFTNPDADLPARGVVYNEAAARRSWASLEAFLAEALA